MRNPKLIIPLGIGFFALALIDVLSSCPDQIYNVHRCLSALGWIGVVGVCACLLWLFVSNWFLRKKK
jgi:hypothetical protein